MDVKFASAFVIAMMMVGAFPAMALADEGDAALGTATGSYTVFYYDSTSESWNHSTASTYDAAQALKSSGFWMSGDSMVDKTTSGDYPSPNYNYGDISTFRGIAESGDDVWNVLVYQGDEWVLGSSYLGWYTCFSDQPTSWQTANIALYYGTSDDSESQIEDLESYVEDQEIEYKTAVQVGTDAAFQFSFYLRMTYSGAQPTFVSSGNVSITAEELTSGKTIVAYGSNAYLALKWAFGTNLSAVEDIPGIHYSGTGYDYWEYYSWIYSLFGLGTVQTAGQSTPSDWTDDKYAYWGIYTSYSGLGDDDDVLADFVIGQYAPLSCAEISDNTIALVYAEFSM